MPSLSLALPLFPHPEELSTDLPSPSPSYVFEYPVPPRPLSSQAPPSTSLPSRRISHSDIDATATNEDSMDAQMNRPNPPGLPYSNIDKETEHIQSSDFPDTHPERTHSSDLPDTHAEHTQPSDPPDTHAELTQPSDLPDTHAEHTQPSDLPDTHAEHTQPSDLPDTRTQPSNLSDVHTEHAQPTDVSDTQTQGIRPPAQTGPSPLSDIQTESIQSSDHADGQNEHMSSALLDVQTEHVQILEFSDENPESPASEPQELESQENGSSENIHCADDQRVSPEPDLQSDFISVQTDALFLNRRPSEGTELTCSVQHADEEGVPKYMSEDIQMDYYESSVPPTARREPCDDPDSHADDADIPHDTRHPRMTQRHSIPGSDYADHQKETSKTHSLSKLLRAKTEPNLNTKSTKKHRVKPVKPKPKVKPRYRSRSSSPYTNSAFLPRLPAATSLSSPFPKLPKRYKGTARRRKISKDHLSPPTLFPKLASDAPPPPSYPQSLRPPQSPSIFT
ncbi:germ cell nuclear acidic protein-like [Penaeus vannamei]|uniref:germ cell nuclear acidic protein-like n=1 Tax=Penaeus vannamei TaxID=6689 RepID=UPI00387F70B6